MKIALVVSSPMTIEVFLQDQIHRLSEEHDVTIIANTTLPSGLGHIVESGRLGVNVKLCPICIERKISPLKDVMAFFALRKLFKRESFDVVHSITPKAGLLAMSASVFASIPNRIHTFTGQVWATKYGLSRFALKLADKLIYSLTTLCLVDSKSQRQFLIKEGVISESRSHVLAKGSISGVDTKRFSFNLKARQELRCKFHATDDTVIFLFLGRLNPDKGIIDLANAFDKLVSSAIPAILLVVGPDETGIQPQIELELKSASGKIHFIGYTENPEDYMSAADVFCLPSYREGFGSVIIEAASVGIPAIGSRIYGITDAILEGETGLLHESGCIVDLHNQMKTMANDSCLRKQLGANAKQRAHNDFTTGRLTEALVTEYQKLSLTMHQ